VLLRDGDGGYKAEGRFLDRLVLELKTDAVGLILLKRASIPFRSRAIRDGRVLLCRDRLARERFEATYAEAFQLLEVSGVLDKELADDLQEKARFRNRIEQFYANVDLAEVYRILHERLGDFDRYLRAIEKYLSGPKD
jgi:hypothetical protein